MHFGILQMSLNSSAIRSRSSDVWTALYNGCSFAGLTYNAFYCILSNSKIDYLKDANDSPVARYLKQTPRNVRRNGNYTRERRSKEKMSGSGATAKGKRPYYDIMNFLEHYLQRRNTTDVPQTAAVRARAHERFFCRSGETAASPVGMKRSVLNVSERTDGCFTAAVFQTQNASFAVRYGSRTAVGGGSATQRNKPACAYERQNNRTATSLRLPFQTNSHASRRQYL
jgi:hypothetical protein